MKRFIEFVTRWRDYIVFLTLIVIALSFVSIDKNPKTSAYRAFLVMIMGSLQQNVSIIPNTSALRSENKAIREMNLYLSSELTRSRKSILENERLRNMLDFKENANIEVLSAEVVGRSIIELRSYITINRGTDDGIRTGMCVRTDVGLFGTIVVVSNSYSLVELISNRHVKISSKVRRNGLNGILVWGGGDTYILKNLPESYDVRKGDVIITSNYSNKYPSDVPIGTVVDIEKEENSLFMKVIVKPFNNFNTTEQVFVSMFISDSVRLALIEEMERKLLVKEKK